MDTRTRPNATEAPRRRRRRRTWTRRLTSRAAVRSAEFNRRVLETLARMPTTTPTVAELAAALGVDPGELGPALAELDRTGRVERWADPERAGGVRLMLSARV